MDSLPTDLLLEVFCRLPCKDIVVCKSVCRAWYHLLSHPNFSRRYAQNPPFTSVFLLQHSRTASGVLLEFPPEGGPAIKTLLSPKSPNFYFNPTETHMSFVIGSCNGLMFFCQSACTSENPLHYFEKVFCSNPLSGDCVLVAEHELSCESSELYLVEYRIGYISSTDTVKLLALVKGPEAPEQSYILTVGIDRGWRRLDAHSLDYHHREKGASFNGVYHWINEDTMCLKTFDFEGERVIGSEWKLPNHYSNEDTYKRELAVLKNHLSVIEKGYGFEMVIWIMEEYGVAESWSILMILEDGNIYDLNLKAILGNGDLLLWAYYNSEITLFSSEKEDGNYIKVHSCESHRCGIRYAGEFIPRFCSIDRSWSIHNG